MTGGNLVAASVGCLVVFFGCLILSRGMLTATARGIAEDLPANLHMNLFWLYRDCDAVEQLLPTGIPVGINVYLEMARERLNLCLEELRIVEGRLSTYEAQLAACRAEFEARMYGQTREEEDHEL